MSDRSRRPRWGSATPANAQDARARILAAARRCFERKSPRRTTMSDIAREAEIHRTTVYSYFATKEMVVASAFADEVDRLFRLVAPVFDAPAPFTDRLTDATTSALTYCRDSPSLRYFLINGEAGYTMTAMASSQEVVGQITEHLAPYIESARTAGEIRSDVSASRIALWIVRTCFSLAASPGTDAEGGDEAILRTFIANSLLAPAVHEGASVGANNDAAIGDAPGRRMTNA